MEVAREVTARSSTGAEPSFTISVVIRTAATPGADRKTESTRRPVAASTWLTRSRCHGPSPSASCPA
ncbi:hypothetical protein Prum_020540 [Phytohabitans rumicis]|uniref:Uncharacterized protein n=1 Tax=Phytohabitans rumicis TaxID=1076125 RepID=A0A6V8KTG5_9ACTN|nr:hypothetical protein Prum_020540 [Phytohabitans rumicis]